MAGEGGRGRGGRGRGGEQGRRRAMVGRRLQRGRASAAREGGIFGRAAKSSRR